MEWLNLINPIYWFQLFSGWIKRPRPIIKFEFKAQNEVENDYCHCRYNIDTGGLSWFFRLSINNLGKTPIRNADVRVEKILRVFPDEKIAITGTPFFLHWANENTNDSRIIYPETPVFVDMVYTNQGNSQIFIFNKQKHAQAGIKNNLAPGKYLITIKLLGENISPIERVVEVESYGSWDTLRMFIMSEDGFC